MNNNKLIIFNDHFFPAYKAGGPIQSLTNLVTDIDLMGQKMVITSAYDLNSNNSLKGIEPNSWNSIELIKQTKVDVWYDGGISNFKSVISDAHPDVVYLNGMFSLSFVIKPLLICKRANKDIRIVLCPRGMLQKGALTVKPFKKKVFLSMLRLSGLLNNVVWHATNEEEKEDIKHVFGRRVNVVVAPNIPKKPLLHIKNTEKVTNKLRLVYLSLITEKKNLTQLIKLINSCPEGVTLDIYGPIKDEKYWTECKRLMEKNEFRITYKGDVLPHNVQDVLSQYDAFILLTKGENFGHALYESLSVGRPIITSYFTPWNDLEKKQAGWNLDISDSSRCKEMLEQIAELDQQSFERNCRGAHSLAKDYYDNLNAKEKYRELFGIN